MKIIIKIVKGILYFCTVVYMYFFTGRLKVMLREGEAIIAEPNKLIAGFEFIFGVILTMFLVYIGSKYIFGLYKDFWNYLNKKDAEDNSNENHSHQEVQHQGDKIVSPNETCDVVSSRQPDDTLCECGHENWRHQGIPSSGKCGEFDCNCEKFVKQNKPVQKIKNNNLKTNNK